MKAARLIINVFVVLLGASVLNGCLLRDPHIQLANGYSIGATSWSEPCSLKRYMTRAAPPSPWRALEQGGALLLLNTVTGEERTFDDPDAWRAASRAAGAWMTAEPRPDHIVAFASDERYAIGRTEPGFRLVDGRDEISYAGGGPFFLVDLHEHTAEFWTSEDEWAAAVRSRTALNPQRLGSPTAWHRQYRRPEYWAIMGVYAGVALVCSVVAWRTSREYGTA
jgi:hypothetical protein